MLQLPYLVIMELHIASSSAYSRGASSIQHSLGNIFQCLTLLLSNDTQTIHKLVKGDSALTLHLRRREKQMAAHLD